MYNLLKLKSRLLFPLFCRLFTIFFIDSEVYLTIPRQFPRCFSTFYEKSSTLGTFHNLHLYFRIVFPAEIQIFS